MIRSLIQNKNALSTLIRRKCYRSIFTNTDLMKKDDPYATLGIQWGATTSEIKDAFKKKAKELHPDVNNVDTPDQALKKFQRLQWAYQKLMDVKGAPHRDDLLEEWSFAVWRNSDIIAQEREDVAGVMRKRPIKPADSIKPGSKWGIATLGHPDQTGNKPRRAEYLGEGNPSNGPRSNTVGTGVSKYTSPKKKEFKPWNPNDIKVKAASRRNHEKF
jgi:DnaJ-class molecular chaperone with C-terminal Zn finger domain